MSGTVSIPSTAVDNFREYVGSVTQKGMVTIPQGVRRRLNIRPKGKVIFRVVEDTVEIKSMPMTLEETFGSVKPLNRPENFKQLRDVAIEEHVDKVISKMNR